MKVSLPINATGRFDDWYKGNNHAALIPRKVVFNAPIIYTQGMFIRFLRDNDIFVVMLGLEVCLSVGLQHSHIENTTLRAKTNDEAIIKMINSGMAILSKWIDKGEVPF